MFQTDTFLSKTSVNRVLKGSYLENCMLLAESNYPHQFNLTFLLLIYSYEIQITVFCKLEIIPKKTQHNSSHIIHMQTKYACE